MMSLVRAQHGEPKPKDRYKTSTCPLVLVLRNGEKQSKKRRFSASFFERGLRAMEERGRRTNSKPLVQSPAGGANKRDGHSPSFLLDVLTIWREAVKKRAL